jgi:hypothetical protein
MSLFYDPTDSVEPWLPKQLGQVMAVESTTVDVLFKGQTFAGCAVPGGVTTGISIGDKVALVIPFGATRVWALPDPTEKQEEWNSFADIQYTSHYPKSINEWIARGKTASAAIRWIMNGNQKFYRYHEAKVLSFDDAGAGNYARIQSPILPSDKWYPVTYGKQNAYVKEGDQVLVWRSKYWSSPGEYFVLGSVVVDEDIDITSSISFHYNRVEVSGFPSLIYTFHQGPVGGNTWKVSNCSLITGSVYSEIDYVFSHHAGGNPNHRLNVTAGFDPTWLLGTTRQLKFSGKWANLSGLYIRGPVYSDRLEQYGSEFVIETITGVPTGSVSEMIVKMVPPA